jgi:hypothetical protein
VVISSFMYLSRIQEWTREMEGVRRGRIGGSLLTRPSQELQNEGALQEIEHL